MAYTRSMLTMLTMLTKDPLHVGCLPAWDGVVGYKQRVVQVLDRILSAQIAICSKWAVHGCSILFVACCYTCYHLTRYECSSSTRPARILCALSYKYSSALPSSKDSPLPCTTPAAAIHTPGTQESVDAVAGVSHGQPTRFRFTHQSTHKLCCFQFLRTQ